MFDAHLSPFMKQPENVPLLALVCGDPAGVGPGIIARWAAAHPARAARCVPIGPPAWLEMLPPVFPQLLGIAPKLKLTPGKPSKAGAKAAWDALETAAHGCREGWFSGVVTGPVSKSEMAAAGWTFPGQTEFFAERWGGDPVMGFSGDKMRVTLATWHIPLSEVPKAVTVEKLTRAVAAADALARAHGVAAPKIAVCGLNPHAGEDGLLGSEEKETLDPALKKLAAKFPGLHPRCLPGDTVFWRHLKGDFDAVVALYHDQGLAPLKTLEFDTAVNVTLGLPHVRTSPDHGTAFDLAASGKASFTSWDRAVALAEKLVDAG